MRISLGLVALFAFGIAPALADDVPDNLSGLWAVDGACDVADQTLEIAEGKMSLAGGDAADITYFENDSPSGNGAIHWAEEGNVDNFEYDAASDRLLYNAQGYGMGIDPVVYSRCP